MKDRGGILFDFLQKDIAESLTWSLSGRTCPENKAQKKPPQVNEVVLSIFLELNLKS